jgi:hypothetical protein
MNEGTLEVGAVMYYKIDHNTGRRRACGRAGRRIARVSAASVPINRTPCIGDSVLHCRDLPRVQRQ